MEEEIGKGSDSHTEIILNNVGCILFFHIPFLCLIEFEQIIHNLF